MDGPFGLSSPYRLYPDYLSTGAPLLTACSVKFRGHEIDSGPSFFPLPPVFRDRRLHHDVSTTSLRGFGQRCKG
ncbi:hypothetical protein N7468_006509 [Penicillium chermesinum]|uniref:Uncharacterized protein n=1 Tax=Penicillium chermesinum TaxID=63820 RepID=A0A9W9NSG6_9EURO|nr:uncharacterized protein N7468_006509 [Penicillium chermesinum]KAJ5225284.1 hypothetical protein N7468_006509 [Penicillium chermesinum]